MWLRLLRKVVRHEELDFLFHYILINFIFHVPTWLAASLLDGTGLRRGEQKPPGGLSFRWLQASWEPRSVDKLPRLWGVACRNKSEPGPFV